MPSRLELLVHALSGESTCTSTGERNVSNHPRCLHGTASATAGSMGCVLEVERELLCPPVERPSTPLFTHLRERYHEASASLVTTCIGLLQRMGGGKKQKCVENVEINVTVIFYEDTRGITQTAARRPRARSRCVRCPHRRQ